MRTLRYYEEAEIRSESGSSRLVIGYALKFNCLSQNLGGFREIIAPGALDKADLSDVVGLFNHDQNLILCRTTAKTLLLSIDEIGLRYEFTAPNTTAGNDLLENIKNKAITGSSFSFVVAPGGDSWDRSSGSIPVRTINRIAKLIDISPVVFPAYQDTEVYSRFLESCDLEKRSLSNPQTQNIQITNERTMKKVTLIEAINQQIAGKYSPEVRELINRAKKTAKEHDIKTVGNLVLSIEERDLTTANASLVGNDVIFDFVEPFRSASVLVQAGASYIPNIKNNVTIPISTGVKCDWATETGTAIDGANLFDKITFTPKRISATIKVSRQLLLQTDGLTEFVLRNDITKALADKLQETVLGKYTTAAIKPDGFFTGLAIGDLAINGSITRDKIIAMEAALAPNNIGRNTRAFITSEAGALILKKAPRVLNSDRFLYEGGQMIDQPVFVTNHVPADVAGVTGEQGIIYGNWSDLIIGQFGIIDILVDPYTFAETAAVKIVVNAYFDAKPRNANAFSVGSFKA